MALNENDIEKAEQIIQKAKREHKEEIQAWNEEQLRRNLHIQNNYS